jgi:hypothetical protein
MIRTRRLVLSLQPNEGYLNPVMNILLTQNTEIKYNSWATLKVLRSMEIIFRKDAVQWIDSRHICQVDCYTCNALSCIGYKGPGVCLCLPAQQDILRN